MCSTAGTKNILDELDINPCIVVQAQRAGYVSASHILGASQTELEHKLGLSAFHIKNLIAAVTSHVLPKKLTAWEMAHESSNDVTHLTTGCPRLDDFLCGGVTLGSVTEVTGQSGSGKTQMALQLALHAQLPPSCGGLGAGVAYICTESQFPLTRLQQMIPHMHRKFPRGPYSYTDNIFVHHVPDMDNLVDCVQYQLPVLVSRHGVKLVVIDSVAASFRAEDSREVNKSALIQSLGYQLHQLAASRALAVVAINQVTATMGATSLYGMAGDTAPALGLSWANLVTTRLMLTRTHSNIPAHQVTQCRNDGAQCSNGGSDPISSLCHSDINNSKTQMSLQYNVRLMDIVFCPWLCRKIAAFIVNEEGIRGIDEDEIYMYASVLRNDSL